MHPNASRLFALLLTLTVAACSRPAPETAEGEGSAAAEEAQAGTEAAPEAEEAAEAPALVVYSGRKEAMVSPLVERFESETGVDVRVNYAGSAQLAATILEEGDATPACVFFGQDSSTLGLLERQERLTPLPEALTSMVPPAFRSSTGQWVGTSGRARVLTYNTERLSEEQLPAQLDALTEPAWRGRVGWAPENASFQSFLAAMVALRGEDGARAWVEAMLGNEPRAYPSNTPGVVAVATGEIDLMLTNHYYMYRVIEERGAETPLANHYLRSADAGSLVNIAGLGIVKECADTETAERFIRFMLTEASQAHFVEANAEFPVIGSVPSREGLPKLDDLNVPELELTQLANLEAAVRILQETGAL